MVKNEDKVAFAIQQGVHLRPFANGSWIQKPQKHRVAFHTYEVISPCNVLLDNNSMGNRNGIHCCWS